MGALNARVIACLNTWLKVCAFVCLTVWISGCCQCVCACVCVQMCVLRGFKGVI